MKKVIAPILAAILIMGLAACSVVDNIVGEVLGGLNSSQSSSDMGGNMPGGNGYMPGGNTQGESSGMSGGIDLAAVTEEDVKPIVDVFAGVVAENFGIDADFENGKSAIINPKDGSKKILDLSPYYREDGSRDLSSFPGYESDPTDASYFEVLNYKSLSELCAYLDEYMLPEIYESYVADNFSEVDGVLYLVRGGRGYGAVTCGNITSVTPGSDSLEVIAERQLFEEPDGLYILTLKEIGGRLKIVSALEEEAKG